MNIDKDRKDNLAIKRKAPSMAARLSCYYYPSELLGRFLYILLVASIIVTCFAGLATAEPVNQTGNPGEAEVLSPLPSSEETTGVTSGLKEDENSHDKNAGASSGDQSRVGPPIQPESEPNGKFLVPLYDDPGDNKKEQSFIVQLLYTIFDIIKYIFYFGLVIAIGLLAIYGVKVFMTKYNAITGGGEELLNVLEIRHLAPGKALCLVEVAGKVLVLWIAGNNINPLSELTDIEQVEMLKHMAARKPEPLQPFQAYLEKFTDRFSSTQEKKLRESIKKEQGTTVSDSTNWRDDLGAAGENINKILEEIKKQDRKRSRDAGSDARRDRGEKGR